jgi:hypothetical protein
LETLELSKLSEIKTAYVFLMLAKIGLSKGALGLVFLGDRVPSLLGGVAVCKTHFRHIWELL